MAGQLMELLQFSIHPAFVLPCCGVHLGKAEGLEPAGVDCLRTEYILCEYHTWSKHKQDDY